MIRRALAAVRRWLALALLEATYEHRVDCGMCGEAAAFRGVDRDQVNEAADGWRARHEATPKHRERAASAARRQLREGGIIR